MIIVDIKCGMGNQMFQYAYARALQELHGGKEHIYINLVTAARMKDGRRYALSNCYLKNNVRVLPLLFQYIVDFFCKIKMKLLMCVKEQSTEEGKRCFLASHGLYASDSVFRYIEIIPCKNIWKYCNGWWQSYQYFEKIGDSIRRELKIKTPPSEANKNMLIEISKTEAVCVHIRRGDYLSQKFASELNICDELYYQRGMEEIIKKVKHPVFYIFTTSLHDIDWIRSNWRFPGEVKYVDLDNPDYEELRLMYSCRHFILANSTFSWWAAYLCDNPQKKVVVPAVWNRIYSDFEDIYMDGWIRI